MIKKTKPDNAFWQRLSIDDFILNIENNELTHQLLRFLYKFSNGTKLPWDKFQSKITKEKIKSSSEANEFISDASSINGQPLGMTMILARNLLAVELKDRLSQKASNREKKVPFITAPEYRYTNNFFKEQLEKIYSSVELEKLFPNWAQEFAKILMEKDRKDKIEDFFCDKTKELLSEIKKEDIKTLQSAYLEETKDIMMMIEKVKDN